MVRVGGRLDNAPLDRELKHQAILPADHHVTRLIMCHFHICEGHAGTNQTLAAIRQQNWIIKGPATVKRIISKQIMAPLPEAQVTAGKPPFLSMGIDYFGPLKVTWRHGTAKCYACIFTCLAIRAVHIEISYDLTTDSFTQAVCRFVSRQGPPREVFSDNGSNF